MEKMLNCLVLARHGEYVRDSLARECLTDSGHRNVKLLAFELRSALRGRRVTLLSSDAPRSIQTAEIIAKEIDVPFTALAELHSGPGYPVDYERLWELIAEFAPNDVVILVTHHEYLEGFPNFFARRIPNVFDQRSWCDKFIAPGEALHLDVERGTRRLTASWGSCFV